MFICSGSVTIEVITVLANHHLISHCVCVFLHDHCPELCLPLLTHFPYLPSSLPLSSDLCEDPFNLLSDPLTTW